MTQPEGQTPHAPDVDQPDGGAHGGAAEQDDSGRTPSVPDNDTVDDGTHDGS